MGARIVTVEPPHLDILGAQEDLLDPLVESGDRVRKALSGGRNVPPVLGLIVRGRGIEAVAGDGVVIAAWWHGNLGEALAAQELYGLIVQQLVGSKHADLVYVNDAAVAA